jgi:hypothetical protein
MPEMCLAILLGVGFYVAVNVVAVRLGMVPAGSEIAGVSGTVRNSVPFGPAFNNFGGIAASLMGFSLIGLFYYQHQRKWMNAAACLACIVVGIEGALVVQIRSAIFILFLTIGWRLLSNIKIGRWYSNAVLLVGLLLPIIVVYVDVNAVISTITPDVISDLFQRREGDLQDLNGRFFAWKFGIETVISGDTGFFGQGILERDASDAFNEQFSDWNLEAATMHNGMLDVIAVYGPLVGITLFGVLFHFGRRFGGHSIGSRSIGNANWMLSGFLITIIGCGWLESFYTMTLFWGLMLAVAIGFGGLQMSRAERLLNDESHVA